MTTPLTNAEWSAAYAALVPTARKLSCVHCGRSGVRVGVTPADVPVVDVLCCSCFEASPMHFKLTSAQDVFRCHVKAGVHPRIAARATAVATRGEKLADMTADIAWFKRAVQAPEGET